VIVQRCIRCGRDFETAVRFREAICIECGSRSVSAPLPSLAFDENEATRKIRPRTPSQIIGETIIRGHCTFRWAEPIGPGARVYDIGEQHCDDCITELHRLGFVRTG
jgi:hypothetical protein